MFGDETTGAFREGDCSAPTVKVSGFSVVFRAELQGLGS